MLNVYLVYLVLLQHSRFAGPFGDVNNGAVDYRQTSLKAKVPCKTLVQQTNTEFSVISSISIDGVCRVSGVIPGEIRFEVNLPDNWYGRMMMTGNGGLGGQAPESAGSQQQRDGILEFGFATAYTDTGHDNRVEPGGSFEHNNLAVGICLVISWLPIHTSVCKLDVITNKSLEVPDGSTT